jgi:hypothetical protein
MHQQPLYYIRFTHENPEEGVAYWGPFPKDQLHHRLNDAAAVEMEEWGTVDSIPVGLVDPDAFINPPEKWIAEAVILEEEGYDEEK